MAASNDPLSFMDKLSPVVSLYRPQANAHSATSDPALIVVASWTGAREVHIAKYIAMHRQLFPASSILLIQSTMQLFMNSALVGPAEGKIGPAVQPAISVIRTLSASPSTESRPSILVHIFSNGGSSTMATLYDEYAAAAGRDESRQMPLHVTIFDSSPSPYRIHRAVTFIQLGMPPLQRILSTPFIYLLALGQWVLASVGLLEDKLRVWAMRHNDPNTVLETRRTYIYSNGDELIGNEDVEEHADQAQRAGFVVEKEHFNDSPHVLHVRTDPERYWGVVERTWRGSNSS